MQDTYNHLPITRLICVEIGPGEPLSAKSVATPKDDVRNKKHGTPQRMWQPCGSLVFLPPVRWTSGVFEPPSLNAGFVSTFDAAAVCPAGVFAVPIALPAAGRSAIG